jgi:hypothetical protein
MNNINNPMAQLARLYAAIEAELRRAAREQYPTSIDRLRQNPDIADLEKSAWQVRDLVRTLHKRGFVAAHGTGRRVRYAWNLDAPPLTFRKKQLERMYTAPSEPVIERTEPGATTVVTPLPFTEPAAPAAVTPESMTPPIALQNKEVEFVFHGVEFVVGINPATGNLRLKIEKG